MMPMQTESRYVFIAERIEAAWPHILPGLEEMQRQARCDWDIDYIHDMLADGEAMLVLDLEEPNGFAVVELKPHNYKPSELELFVHLAYCHSGDAIERFEEKFVEIAREGGAKYMRFHSSRPGMLKLMQPYGYRWQSAEYVKEL
jgi:hypothetical protein